MKIACLAQLSNVIIPIMTRNDGGRAQTIYWPFLHASRYGRGTALRAIENTPVYHCADCEGMPPPARVLAPLPANRKLNLVN